MKRNDQVILLGVLSLLCSHLCLAAAWPKMAEVQTTIGIDTSAERIDLSMVLRDRQGTLRYLFVCHGGGLAYTDELMTRTGNTWVPPLMCVLNESFEEKESSLLAEDGVAPWHTRGQFRWDDLVGDCGSYPEFGRDRSFRLRGFRLRLEVIDPIMADEKLSYFKLRISLQNDPSATSRFAARPGYRYPKDCKNVLKGAERRLCRGKDFIREPCKD